MNHNLPASADAAIIGVIDPASKAAGDVSTVWIDASKFFRFMAIVQAGVLGAAATLDAKIEQATSAAGANAKDVTGKAITQLTKVGEDDSKQAIINLRQTDLDFNNGFTHFRLTATVATAASLISGLVLGMDARYGAASDSDAATVDEIIA